MAPRKRVTGFPGIDERRALMEQLKEIHKAVDTYKRLDDPNAVEEEQQKDVKTRLETQQKRQAQAQNQTQPQLIVGGRAGNMT